MVSGYKSISLLLQDCNPYLDNTDQSQLSQVPSISDFSYQFFQQLPHHPLTLNTTVTMRFSATQILLASLASLAFGSPVATETEAVNGVQVLGRDADDSPNHLFTRQGSIFDLCFRGPQPLVLEHQRNMDDLWSLQAISRPPPSGWTRLPGNDDDLEFQAWSTRDAGVARAHFRLRVNPLARFPPNQSVRWGLHRRRGNQEECIRSGTITFADDEASYDFTIDSSASYRFTLQDSYE